MEDAKEKREVSEVSKETQFLDFGRLLIYSSTVFKLSLILC
jgi:hypothetical protein